MDYYDRKSVEQGAEWEREKIIEELEELMESYSKVGDFLSIGWCQRLRALIEARRKPELGRIEKLGTIPHNLVESPWDEGFRKINELIDAVNEMRGKPNLQEYNEDSALSEILDKLHDTTVAINKLREEMAWGHK